MNRAELLDQFETDLAADGSFLTPYGMMPDERSRIVETYPSVDGTDLIEWHEVRYWDNTVQNIRTPNFYVRNRGEVDEEAVWQEGRNPRPPAPTPTFAEEMVAWLRSQIDAVFGALTLRHVENATADDATERGTADVVMEIDASDFVRRSVAVWRDAAGNWQFEVIQ